MKKIVENEIKSFVRNYKIDDGENIWQEPLIGFANAKDDEFLKIKNHISSDKYLLPSDILKEAQTVVSYFIPFIREIPESNINGELSSEEWAKAYYDTNIMLAKLAEHMIEFLDKYNYKSAVPDANYIFDQDKLIGYWSQRHTANIAGLGTFGINNMLITKKGCCGRIGSFVTELKIDESEKINKEYCLYKKNGTCGVCIKKCSVNAYENGKFDRFKCIILGKKNAEKYKKYDEPEICGKCLVNIPCSYKIP